MAAINDLIAQIENSELRARILAELDRMNKQKKFGLVFEEHLPESVKLYDVPVKKNSIVMEKSGGAAVYKVQSVKEGVAECLDRTSLETKSFNVSDLVVIAEFGTPIYPYLKPIDSICNAPDSDLWHTLIEADNYHALQLLEYLYAGKVDCIYIDPPYNTGARDWKYNNDYVDGADEYRHSKWLSFMQRRLALAKKLLNPKESVLIVTIDEKEYLHLGCLLEQMFPGAIVQMVTVVHNPGGAIRIDALNRVNEFAFYVFIGEARPSKTTRQFLPSSQKEESADINRSPIWRGLLRGGSGPLRKDSPQKFYPVLVDGSGRILGAGEPLPLGISRDTFTPPKGVIACWPIKQDGSEGRWELKLDTFYERFRQGFMRAGDLKPDGTRTIYYLRNAEMERLNNGEIVSHGINELGYHELDYADGVARSTFPKTVWNSPRHNATEYGSNLLKDIVGKGRFSYPKSLYAVEDELSFIIDKKKNALVLDFFAGSGTTLHAVNLLNAEDGGHRRCIMVTNNEVSAEEAKSLASKGFQPGDEEWEKLGIARYVTWPRTVCSIKGVDVNGTPLKGNYLGSVIPMAEGFAANAVFFKLGFLDKNSIALGRQFRELLPVLWMKAGAVGPCPNLETEELPAWLILPENKLAVLIDDNQYYAFKQEIEKATGIETLFIITDFEREYAIMADELGIPNTFQLYRDYLDNFRINHSR